MIVCIWPGENLCNLLQFFVSFLAKKSLNTQKKNNKSKHNTFSRLCWIQSKYHRVSQKQRKKEQCDYRNHKFLEQ